MTLSHPAAILLLRGVPLPVVAMVIGSMVPDIPMFLPSRGGYGATHSMLGVLTVDVVATLVLLTAWNHGIRDALVDLSPEWVRGRCAPHWRLSRNEWLLAPFAAALGAFTHIAWDSFTHAGRWGVAHVSVLRGDHFGLPGHQWGQYVSGVIGLVAVCWACFAHLRTLPVRPRPDFRRLPATALPFVLGSTACVAAVAGVSRLADGVHAVAFYAVVRAIQVGTLGVALLCGVWLVVEIRSRVHSEREGRRSASRSSADS